MKSRGWAAARAAALLVLGATAAPASAFTFAINYTDAAGTGFNDPAAAVPVGGNSGTTLGAQRKQAFEFAVNVWAQRIQSSVSLIIDADWADLPCSPSAATLGQAGPTLVITSGLPQANTYYPAALVNAIKGSDVLPANPDISAHFNKGIDTKPVGGCLGSKKFYYGLDQNFGSDVGFINVVVHEIGHGLGFTSLVNPVNGQGKFGDGKFSIFDYSLYDETTSLFLPLESNAQRAAVAISGSSLTFNKANTNAGSSFLDSGGKTNGRVKMFAPNPSQSGSSISHWDTTATPDLVMEPIYTPLDGGAHVDLTTCAFKDIGWTLVVPFLCPDIASASADLQVTITDAPDPVIAGTNVTYTVKVKNLGPDTAANVRMTSKLPASVNFVSNSGASGWSCTDPAVGVTGTVDCTTATLNSGVTATFTIVGNVKTNTADGIVIKNTATATTTTTDPVASNNKRVASTTVNRNANLFLAVTDKPDPVHVGQSLTYTIKVTNNGPSLATGLSLSSSLPASAHFVSDSGATGLVCSDPPVAGTGTVSCTATSLAAGASRTIKVVVTIDGSVPNGTLVSNPVSVSAATVDPVPSDNSRTAKTTIQNP